MPKPLIAATVRATTSAFETAADREVGLVEQVITPLLRQRNPEARARAAEVSRELAALSVALHAALVRAALPA